MVQFYKIRVKITPFLEILKYCIYSFVGDIYMVLNYVALLFFFFLQTVFNSRRNSRELKKN